MPWKGLLRLVAFTTISHLLVKMKVFASTFPTTTVIDSDLTPLLTNESFQLSFNPPAINRLPEDANQTVYFNCTCSFTDQPQRYNQSYLVTISSSNGKIAKLLTDEVPKTEKDMYEPDPPGPYFSDGIVLYITLNTVHNFTIKAMHVGYVSMSLKLHDTDNSEMVKAGLSTIPAQEEYRVAVARVTKPADFIFNCSAAAVAILISFGIGCVTDTESLKRQLKYPVSLVIGFCCQFILMPVFAFAIAMVLDMEPDVEFGLLCVACVPGGGLGHVAAIISNADLPLSLTMNLISIVAMLGTAPLWIFVLGQYLTYQSNDDALDGSKIIPIYNFEIWLASTFFAYTAGLVINRFKPSVADGLLTWIIKPFLLLATILYITLGVYINMYVFEVIEDTIVGAAILLPLCGLLSGYIISVIFRQKTQFSMSVALETSSLNCLIVLAALRFSLKHSTAADMASKIPIWVMFTIPGLYVILAILRVFKNCIENFFENRKAKQFRNYSIASGIVNQANMTALSAPLFVTDGTDEDQQSISEKITVL